MPQWGCVKAVWFILLIMVITRPMKLEKVLVNDKIAALWWTNISPKHYSCILNLTNKKNEELLDSKRDCVSWLSSHVLLQPITRPYMIRHGTWGREWENHSIVSNKICLPSMNDIKRYKQLKLNFDKMLGWQNFQKPQLQSVSIFFKFVHSSDSYLFCICCVTKTYYSDANPINPSTFFFFQHLTWTSSRENPSTPSKRGP